MQHFITVHLRPAPVDIPGNNGKLLLLFFWVVSFQDNFQPIGCILQDEQPQNERKITVPNTVAHHQSKIHFILTGTALHRLLFNRSPKIRVYSTGSPAVMVDLAINSKSTSYHSVKWMIPGTR